MHRIEPRYSSPLISRAGNNEGLPQRLRGVRGLRRPVRTLPQDYTTSQMYKFSNSQPHSRLKLIHPRISLKTIFTPGVEY